MRIEPQEFIELGENGFLVVCVGYGVGKTSGGEVEAPLFYVGGFAAVASSACTRASIALRPSKPPGCRSSNCCWTMGAPERLRGTAAPSRERELRAPQDLRLRSLLKHVLAWRSGGGNWVWTFVMDDGHGTTRLISRNRYRLPTLPARIGMVPVEAASLVMEAKMLRGIKQRAEQLASGATKNPL